MIGINEDSFSVSVLRALSASLLLDPRMEGVRVQFVKGGTLRLTFFSERRKSLPEFTKNGWISRQFTKALAAEYPASPKNGR